MKFYFKIAGTGFEPVFTAYEAGLEPLSLLRSHPYGTRTRIAAVKGRRPIPVRPRDVTRIFNKEYGNLLREVLYF